MKKIIFKMIDLWRKVRGMFCTFWLKKQVVSCGKNIGAARVPKISRLAKVHIGHNCGFNGMTISGQGGGKDWKLLPLWN